MRFSILIRNCINVIYHITRHFYFATLNELKSVVEEAQMLNPR